MANPLPGAFDIEPDGEDGAGPYVDSRGVEVARLSFRDALTQVLQLARSNAVQPLDIAFGDAGLADQQVWEARAIATTAALLATQGGPFDALGTANAAGDWPQSVWAADRGMDPEHSANAIRIVLSMAEAAAINVEEVSSIAEAEAADGQQLAFDVTRDLLGLHGAALAPQAAGPRP